MPKMDYPEPLEGPDVPYTNPPKPSNPVLRGLPLLIVSFLLSKIDFLAGFLWRNAGFGALRTLKELGPYEPRADPTVIAKSAENSLPVEHRKIGHSDDSSASDGGPVARHYSIADYHHAYKSGMLTPVAVAQALLELIPLTYGTVFIDLRRQQCLEAAEASTKRFKMGKPLGILDGVPVGVKDEVDLSGCKTTMGSANDFTRTDSQSSWCVQKWEEAGAVILGKLNMHEFGLDTTNNNLTYGTPPNPHSAYHYPGGSSGGSASAVSLGLIPLALGADGGGSIRIPSSYCSLFGLKPTHGRISIRPTTSLDPTVGVTGPIAGNIADLAIGYCTMAVPDPQSGFVASFPQPVSTLGTTNLSPSKLIGVYDPWFARADKAVFAACQQALDRYKAAGWTSVPITIPLLPQGQPAHAITILSEISTAMSQLAKSTATPIRLSSANKILMAVAKQTTAQDLLQAQKLRNLLMQHLSAIYKKHPGIVIVTPTTPNAGWLIEKASDLTGGFSDADKSVRSMEYVWLANFIGCPAISVPAGFIDLDVPNSNKAEDKVRFPVGLMGMAEWGNEAGLFDWATEGEQLTKEEGGGDWRPKNGWVDVFKLAQEKIASGK